MTKEAGMDGAEAEGQGPVPRSRILRNRVRCRFCREIIESLARHDYRQCGCGRVSVDGGREYLKRSGGPLDFEELSEVEVVEEGESEGERQARDRGRQTGR